MKNIVVVSLGISSIALFLGAFQAQGQSVPFNFTDDTSDGWYLSGFSDTTPASVVTVNGNNYISTPIGGYQVANVASGNSGSSFYQAMAAAINNPAGYELTYNYYIDTSTFTTAGTYLQLSSFVNTGSGFYASAGTPSSYDPSFNGTQVASGSVFSGTVTVPFSAFGTDANAATETYFRMGFILNGDGTGVNVDYTDINIVAVPEPSSLALCAMGAMGALALIRRKA
jgi:PEP-CTERM motif